jgi:hypothetical protein
MDGKTVFKPFKGSKDFIEIVEGLNCDYSHCSGANV